MSLTSISTKSTPIGEDESLKRDLNEIPDEPGDAWRESLQKLISKLSKMNLTGKVIPEGHYAKKTGGQADIFLGTDTSDQMKVAIKRVRLVNLQSDFKVAKRIAREMRVWYKLDHINVLALKGFIVEPDSYPSLVTEWMDNGNLMDYIKGHAEVDSLLMTEGLANGLHYLHEEEVVHADLKAANVLIAPDGRPLLTDFGISHILHATSTLESATDAQKGTMRWMSPELVNPGFDMEEDEVSNDKVLHTKMSDVWAFGMTILELLTRKIPFAMKSETQAMAALYHGERPIDPKDLEDWKTMDRSLWMLCKKCWELRPGARPTMSELLRDLRKVHADKLRIRGIPGAPLSLAAAAAKGLMREHAPCTAADGSPIFFGTAFNVNAYGNAQPCMVSTASAIPCHVACDWMEILFRGSYDILPFIEDKMELVRAVGGHIPYERDPIQGGYEADERGALYHCVAEVNGQRIPGKAAEHLGGAHVGYDGKEIEVQHYEVLCWKKQ